MSTLESKVESMHRLLLSVENSLDGLTFETFDDVFPKTLNAIKEVHELKSEVLNKYGSDCLPLVKKKLFLNAKQIEDKFDNIVKLFLNEEKKLEKELASTIQRKKLTVYQKV